MNEMNPSHIRHSDRFAFGAFSMETHFFELIPQILGLFFED